MAKKSYSTKELVDVRVLGGKSGTRRIGKVRRFVFHPTEKRLIGFIVKRPDLLWMFRRKDMFVSLGGYNIIDGRIVLNNQPKTTGSGAYKALGVNPDECVLWIGLPVLTKDKTELGIVGEVIFGTSSGKVRTIITSSGATANTLLGTRTIPSDMIIGFRKGVGAALSLTGEEGAQENPEDVVYGAVLVSNEAKKIVADGGLAEKAGAATAVAADKAGKAAAKASETASAAAKVTGEAVNKGAYATGKQLGKTKGMFSNFKNEYDKARGPKGKKK